MDSAAWQARSRVAYVEEPEALRRTGRAFVAVRVAHLPPQHLKATAKAEDVPAAANVRALYLTHLSGRYEQAEVEAEARGIFPGTAVARDFDRITVRPAESAPEGVARDHGYGG